jgi:DMSO/TMAO reductase YedYZ molybdopterin-dependent catalytic subunit
MLRTDTSLPPGQRATDGFPRFGTHLGRRPPLVPEGYSISVDGPGFSTSVVPADLATMPRRELNADFHCVSGWTATDIHWDGVAFATFFDLIVRPRLPHDVTVSHVLLGGLDGHESQLLLEDALGEDVMLADRLDDQPLGPDHGGPVRLVSPAQYGYQSCKHLRRIELMTRPVNRELGTAHRVSRVALRGPFVVRHPRGRVWEEERHTFLPAKILRPFYRRIYERAFRHGLGGEPPQVG